MDKINLEQNYEAKCLELNNILTSGREYNVPLKLETPVVLTTIPNIVQVKIPTIEPMGVNPLIHNPISIETPFYHNINSNCNYQGNFQQEVFLKQWPSNSNNTMTQTRDYNFEKTNLHESNIHKSSVNSTSESFQLKPIDPFANNRKFNQKYRNHYDNQNQRNSSRRAYISNLKKNDLSNIEVSIEKLDLITQNDNIIDLFKIVSHFRRLSYYLQLLCEERHSLETLLLDNSLSSKGYKPNTNYFPTIITDVSTHVNLIKQTITHEFIEFDKLFESIPNNYNEFNNLNLQLKYEFDRLQEFDEMRIRHKNGMLLLSNDKMIALFSIIKNLITIIRRFAIYVKVLQFKLKDIEKEKIKKLSTVNIKSTIPQRNHGN